MKKNMNGNMTAVVQDGKIVVGIAYHEDRVYPGGTNHISTLTWSYDGMSALSAIREAENKFISHADACGFNSCTVFVDKQFAPVKFIRELGPITFIEGVTDAGGERQDSKDPQDIRAWHARRAIEAELDRLKHARHEPSEQKPMTVIVTAGPTNERIDAVMKITNMSTGYLGKIIAETMLDADGEHADCAARIKTLYYISPKLAYKPAVPDGQACKLRLVQIEDAEDLLDEITRICSNEQVDLIVHSSAVGDYKAKYTARAEDLVDEIDRLQTSRGIRLTKPELMAVFENPPCALNDETKMSSYEPHMMTMMTLTPKIISKMRSLAPRALIFGFKLLENVTDEHLFQVGSNLRQKNQVDYIIANDLSRIGGGKHPAMFIGRDHFQDLDAIMAECETKKEIAGKICEIAFGAPVKFAASDDMAGKTYWHVIAANNMTTDVRIEGFAADKSDAWKIMEAEFRKSAKQLTPEIEIPDVIDMDTGFDFNDDGECRVQIGKDSAQVYDGADMWYYNLVPMNYLPA